ncbi:EAL domain-containing protein [Shewanella marina]|uniref:EAL domain-containing protein n=1 Tax=Shewanella marina TaxID=487319 RepID=UPI00131F4692|nr:EAL domain-containing protein [Shewanella marina]
MHLGQSIVDRNNHDYGVQILSRPLYIRDKFEPVSFYSTLLPTKHNALLVEIIDKIYVYQQHNNTKAIYYFINVERFSLLDSRVVDSLCELSKFVDKFNSKVVVELTERHVELNQYIVEAEFKLRDAGVYLAFDNFTYQSELLPSELICDFVKMDISYIKSMINKVWFIDWLYHMEEHGIKMIAERIETQQDYQLALSLPVNYLQGFYRI